MPTFSHRACQEGPFAIQFCGQQSCVSVLLLVQPLSAPTAFVACLQGWLWNQEPNQKQRHQVWDTAAPP
jgi:hypothetical protein